ncbi:MAG TPA: transcriptional regulator [Acidimicrobiales bacterium]|nr:transcriptional regulator [Acidimicrobiales bacterium]
MKTPTPAPGPVVRPAPAERDAVHPTTALTDVVHQRSRLGILSVLSECGRADFPYLKSLLDLTDGNLGRHLEVLAGEGLISVTKGYEGRRPRTWVEITKAGEAALAAQMAAMKELVVRFESRSPTGAALSTTQPVTASEPLTSQPHTTSQPHSSTQPRIRTV